MMMRVLTLVWAVRATLASDVTVVCRVVPPRIACVAATLP